MVKEEHAPTLRVIGVLEAVAEEKGRISLTQIAEKTGWSKSSLFPVVHTLSDSGYLQGTNGMYSLGLKAVELGVNFLNQNDAMVEIRKIIHVLVNTCLETAHLGVLESGNVVYLYKEECSQSIRMYSSIGKRIPAYGTAIGKALLSESTIEEFHSYYPDGLKPLTPNTITDFNVLFKQLSDVKSTGFAYENEESNEMVCCIAVPIYKDNIIVAAISVAMPVFRMNDEKRELCQKALLIAKHSIESLLIYTGFVFL